jgi:hypothetical protein
MYLGLLPTEYFNETKCSMDVSRVYTSCTTLENGLFLELPGEEYFDPLGNVNISRIFLKMSISLKTRFILL